MPNPPSALPWIIRNLDSDETGNPINHYCSIFSGDKFVASCRSYNVPIEEQKANTEFILQSVNRSALWEELVQGLRRSLLAMGPDDPIRKETNDLIRRAGDL